jgi:hypothetical protein
MTNGNSETLPIKLNKVSVNMNILEDFCNRFFVKKIANKNELNKTLNTNKMMEWIETICNL